MFISPKEWWTPFRHAHEKPMAGEDRFSLSPHGQGDSEITSPCEEQAHQGGVGIHLVS
jgi:hypothetical protein